MKPIHGTTKTNDLHSDIIKAMAILAEKKSGKVLICAKGHEYIIEKRQTKKTNGYESSSIWFDEIVDCFDQKEAEKAVIKAMADKFKA